MYGHYGSMSVTCTSEKGDPNEIFNQTKNNNQKNWSTWWTKCAMIKKMSNNVCLNTLMSTTPHQKKWVRIPREIQKRGALVLESFRSILTIKFFAYLVLTLNSRLFPGSMYTKYSSWPPSHPSLIQIILTYELYDLYDRHIYFCFEKVLTISIYLNKFPCCLHYQRIPLSI